MLVLKDILKAEMFTNSSCSNDFELEFRNLGQTFVHFTKTMTSSLLHECQSSLSPSVLDDRAELASAADQTAPNNKPKHEQ